MNIWPIYSSVISVALAVTLLVSGISKWRNRVMFEVVLTRLVPRTLWDIKLVDSRRLARLVCVVEIVLAISLLAADGTASQITAAAAVLTFGIFLLVTITAFRRGTPCGCAGKSTSSVQPLDVARAVVFAMVTITLLISRLQEQSTPWRLSAGRLTWSLVAGLVTSAVLLGWLYRPRALGWVSRGSLGEDDFGPSGAKVAAPPGNRVSRRTFLIRGGRMAAAVAGVILGVLGPGRLVPALAGPSGNCQDAYFVCAECCDQLPPATAALCQNCCSVCLTNCGNAAVGQPPLPGTQTCAAGDCEGSCWPGVVVVMSSPALAPIGMAATMGAVMAAGVASIRIRQRRALDRNTVDDTASSPSDDQRHDPT